MANAEAITEMDVIGYDLAVPPPLLMLRSPGSNSIVVSWSSLSTQFALQINTDLTTTNWLPGNYAISTANGTNQSATIGPPLTRKLFFRLKQ